MKNIVTHNEAPVRTSLKKIGVFLALTLALSSIFWALILFHFGTTASYSPLLMWCPCCAVIHCCSTFCSPTPLPGRMN